MHLPDVPLLSMLKSSMTWLQSRQSVLSQNVSNADTPGYVARDLRPVDFQQLMRQMEAGNRFPRGLAVTDPRHISLSPPGQSEFDSADAPDVTASPNGNSVSLEEEMIKVSETQAQYQAAANLYAKALSLMRTAIGKPGS